MFKVFPLLAGYNIAITLQGKLIQLIQTEIEIVREEGDLPEVV